MKPGTLVLVIVALVALAVWCWHPVCVPLSRDEASSFKPLPIEQREESQWGVRTFQKVGAQWCQCKPWLAREMFF
jgi:hypothetical protein